ncbi:MAG: PKD domain-containing protein [Chitinophagales bacterium]
MDTFIIEDNCDSIVQVTTIFEGVIAVFDYFMVDTSIQFFNESQNADHYLWLFGDGMTSNIKYPSHYYPQSGGYGVQLIASNEYCSDTLFKAIEVSFPTGIDLNHHFESIVL